MAYKTIKDNATAEYEEKKSVFIGNAGRIESEEEARSFINSIKEKHREARHNVYAYVIGKNNEVQRYSDDGEPQGTGGIPVLEVIKKNELCDSIIVVTRYFGGTLLGTAGLCRAYTKAAALAVNKAGTFQKIKATVIEFKVDYEFIGKLEYTFAKDKVQTVKTDYSDKVILSIICENDKVDIVKKNFIELTNGKLEFLSQTEGDYFKEDEIILI